MIVWWILRTLLGAWTARFFGERLSLFWTTWSEASAQWQTNMQTWEACKRHAMPTAACSMAARAVATHPILQAFEAVADRTHFCGDTRCTELATLSAVVTLVCLLLGLSVLRSFRSLQREFVYTRPRMGGVELIADDEG